MRRDRLGGVDRWTSASLRKLYVAFKRADKDANGRVDSNELARMFKLRDDVYVQRLVEVLDVDGDGVVYFKEFVVGLAAFVLSGSFGRVRFMFLLLDLNNDGRFSKDELLVAIKAAEARRKDEAEVRRSRRGGDVWGDRRRANEDDASLAPYAADLVRDFEARCPAELGYDEFVNAVSNHPRVFAPANQMWNALRVYADPAVALVRELRRAGDRTFFYGTVLDGGRAADLFAAPPDVPGRLRRRVAGQVGSGPSAVADKRLWAWLNDPKHASGGGGGSGGGGSESDASSSSSSLEPEECWARAAQCYDEASRLDPEGCGALGVRNRNACDAALGTRRYGGHR